MGSILSRILIVLVLLTCLVGFAVRPPPPAAAASPAVLVGTGSLVMGGRHSCYLSNGSLKCWGSNNLGQLGDNTYWDRPTPVWPWGLIGGVAAADVGVDFTCAMASGTVKCWGNNASGQLGNDLGVNQIIPTDVAAADLGGSASLIATGDAHACALVGSSVRCWGLNTHGQLGSTGIDHSHMPLTVSNLPAGIQALVGGGAHTCALTPSGGVKCWGNNSSGQLGNDSTNSSATPVDVTGLASGVSALAAGTADTCALVNGGVQCWGASYTAKPAFVPGLTSGVTALATGAGQCAIQNGAALCWGDNHDGQLGNGSLTPSATPVAVTGLGSGVVAIGASGGSACAQANGQLYCWGADHSGQLGRGSMTRTSIPWVVNDLQGQTVLSIKGGSAHTCALTSAGRVLCWGNNSEGELGDGQGAPGVFSTLPVQVSGLTGGAAVLGGGQVYACAVVNGGAWCWGDNSVGQLGDGTRERRLIPVAVSGLSLGVTALSSAPYTGSAGLEHTCAVVNGGAWCWGDNFVGGLGNGTLTPSDIPVPVSGLSSGVTDMTVGGAHSCAVVGGAAKCWGNNFYGELGSNQIQAYYTTPQNVIYLSSGVTALAAGGSFTCAIVNAGVQCWGRNDHSQLGNFSAGSGSRVPVPVINLTSGVTAISAAGNHACAVMNGNVWCWGENIVSTLNNGQFQDSTSPVQVSGLSGVTAISVSALHRCALTGGQVSCWGSDDSGQLGVGLLNHSTVPVKVMGLAGTSEISLLDGGRAPGSVLNGVVAGFPLNQATTITLSANGQVLGSFTTNFKGFGAFALTTQSASTGYYPLTASGGGQQAVLSFSIQAGVVQRQQGGGYSFDVPAGIANPGKRFYLPFLRR